MDINTITKQDEHTSECLTRLTMAIYGLGCGGGGSVPVEKALRKVPGVVQVYINPATEMAYVQCLGRVTEPEQLVHAVEDVGFGAGEVRIR